MSAEMETLKSMPLFSELKASEVSKVATLMHPLHVKEGETLTRTGERAGWFYVIHSGSFMVSFEGGEAFTLHEPGDFLGWSILVAKPNYAGTSVALVDSEVLCLRSEDFMRLLQKDVVLGDKIMKTVKSKKDTLRHGFSFSRY